MKQFKILTLATFLILFSCNKSSDVDNPRYLKNIDYQIDPCDLIDRGMIVCHFGMSSTDLKIIEEYDQSNSTYSQCGYRWKKNNFEEIQSERSKMLQTASLSGGGTNSDVLNFSDFPSSYNHIKLGQFRTYSTKRKARAEFLKAHRISAQNLCDENKSEKSGVADQNNYADQPRAILGNFPEDAKSDLKFLTVDGVGDQAFYNCDLNALDVRFGTLTFSVFIHTEFNKETDILIAKKLAHEVWKKL